MRHAGLLDPQRQHRAEAAIDELQSEDDPRHQHEIAEGEHAPGGDASRSRPRPRSSTCVRRVVVENMDDDQDRAASRSTPLQHRNAPRKPTRPASGTAEHRTDRRANPLRGLHDADGVEGSDRAAPIRPPSPARAIHSRRTTPERRADAKHMPRRASHTPSRPSATTKLTSERSTMILRPKRSHEPTPSSNKKRGEPGGDAKAQPGPHRHLADIGPRPSWLMNSESNGITRVKPV